MCDVTSQESIVEFLINLLHSCVVKITVSNQIMPVKEFDWERQREIGRVCGMRALSGSDIFILVV